MTYEFADHAPPPFGHQRDYLTWSAGRRAGALFSDMGTGKSRMLIDEVAQLHEAGLVDTVFVTTYKGNYATWVGEVERYLPRRIDRMVHLWDGSDTAWARRERRDLLGFGGLSFLIMNIEAVSASRKAQQLALQFMGRGRRRMAIVDESPAIKNHEAIRTMQLIKLAGASEYRRIACGNPTPRDPLDLWGQFLFLGQGSGKLLGHQSFYGFRARYSELKTQHIGNGRTVQVPFAWRNLDELEEVVRRHAFRVRKEDCLDLPEKIYETRELDLTPEQHRVYVNVRERAWSQLAGMKTVSSTMVMGQRMKLHQVLCGMVIADDGTVAEIPNHRLAAMLETVEQAGRQTIVWCAYRANAAAVARELRRAHGDSSVVEYHGGVGLYERERSIRRFQGGEADYFVGTPHAGGRGITLTAARQVIYYSNTENLDHRMQSEDRAHRIGQHWPVTYTDLVVPDSMDVQILRNLREKIDISTAIMGDDWRRWVV